MKSDSKADEVLRQRHHSNSLTEEYNHQTISPCMRGDIECSENISPSPLSLHTTRQVFGAIQVHVVAVG